MWRNLPPLRKGDARAMVIAFALGTGVVGVMIYFATDLQSVQAKVNHGFGTGWDCVRMDHGDPVCTKSRP